MNRQARRRDAREAEKRVVTHNLTNEQLAGMMYEAEQKAVISGKREGIRLAVTACMSAYTVAMDAIGMSDKVVEVMKTANEEVFKLLATKRDGEYDLDIDSVREYAERCGVDLEWIK